MAKRATTSAGALTQPTEPGLADAGPLSGFAAAADAALVMLQKVVGLDLWMVLQRRGDQQVAIAVRGDWMPVPTGAVFPWVESFCRHMASGAAPRIAPRCADIPLYADVAATRGVHVGAYVGVPLIDWDGQLFGSICGVSANGRGDALHRHQPVLDTTAQLLSTVLAKEQLAVDRSEAAAVAYAMCDRDPVTGLLNSRGWEEALAVEQHRQLRDGDSTTLVAITLRPSRAGAQREMASRLQPAADVVSGTCRPYDRLARLDSTLAVLAVDCDDAGGPGLASRIESALKGAGLPADVRYLRCPHGGDLQGGWEVCRTSGRVPGEIPDFEEAVSGDALAIEGAGELIRLRAQALRILHAGGLSRSDLVGLNLGDVESVGDGVVLVVDRAALDREAHRGGLWLTRPEQVRILARYRDLLARHLAAQARHPSAPAAPAWPLFPVYAPSGYVTPVRLSDRGLARVLYRETMLAPSRHDQTTDARRATITGGYAH